MTPLETSLLESVRAWKAFRLLVVGDFMLDQALSGDAERLSPDAPVPVLAVRNSSATTDTPGGAGNVAVFAAALGGVVHCVGVVGNDAEGGLLSAALSRSGCGTRGLVVDSARPTTTKRSLIGRAQHRHPQKMFRIDVESREPLAAEIESRLFAAIDEHLGACDVVCLEDYRKGVCSPELCRRLIDRCRERNIPVLVDPAPIDDYGCYRGATVITPNRSEAERATGHSIDASHAVEGSRVMAARLLNELELEAVVITLDKDGALLQTKDSIAEHLPTVARQVYDVTGAGDMVLAVLAGAVANGMPWTEGVTLANIAAGLEVEVFGVRAISLAEIQAQLLTIAHVSAGKLRSRADLLIELAAHRAAGRTIVMTNGCFDIFHMGHAASLREAKGLGDILVVGVNCDEQVRASKGADRPVNTQSDRAELLGELSSVDYVIIFNEPTAEELVRAIRPEVYVKGGDYVGKEVTESAVVKTYGGKTVFVGVRQGLSTSALVSRVRERFVAGGNSFPP